MRHDNNLEPADVTVLAIASPDVAEIVSTIQLSEEIEIFDLEADTAVASLDYDQDSEAEPIEAPVAVPLGSLMSTGGMENEFNSNSRAFKQRAEFISVAVIKPSKRTELGLSLRELVDGGNGLLISGIKDKGFLKKAGAALEIGDRVLSINNQSCEGMDHKRAAKLLREAPGMVLIVVQNIGGDPLIVESMISKPSPGHQTGIGFSSSEPPSRVSISTIFLNGLFADSLLSEGDEIVTVNSIPCRELDSSAVADIVIAAPKYVTVVAKKFEGNGVVVAFDETRRSRSKKWRRRSSTNARRPQRIGPGCQLLACAIFITATALLIILLHARLGNAVSS